MRKMRGLLRKAKVRPELCRVRWEHVNWEEMSDKWKISAKTVMSGNLKSLVLFSCRYISKICWKNMSENQAQKPI